MAAAEYVVDIFVIWIWFLTWIILILGVKLKRFLIRTLQNGSCVVHVVQEC
ncbi:E8 [Oryctolagus cuniculus papillomavirus 1]|uniref:E8 n=1 Tax=Oryctolagus cuniculus papillomavirus 1 TaxID=2772507 RepID=Q9J031_9PAPI|nr:E8 [Oryctolagus cuniculus papillomavirus 1]AAF67122.1 E8 [Oryctolagus cuniculus papillomavirus 1]